MTTEVLDFSFVKNMINMVKEVNSNQTSCSDHFTVYTNNGSLCCILDTNVMLYVNYISVESIINNINKQTTKWDNICNRFTPQRLLQISKTKTVPQQENQRTDTKGEIWTAKKQMKTVYKMLITILCYQFLSIFSD